jgi:hypothetical protein
MVGGDQFFDCLGRCGDPRFTRPRLGWNADFHGILQKIKIAPESYT